MPRDPHAEVVLLVPLNLNYTTCFLCAKEEEWSKFHCSRLPTWPTVPGICIRALSLVRKWHGFKGLIHRSECEESWCSSLNKGWSALRVSNGLLLVNTFFILFLDIDLWIPLDRTLMFYFSVCLAKPGFRWIGSSWVVEFECRYHDVSQIGWHQKVPRTWQSKSHFIVE